MPLPAEPRLSTASLTGSGRQICELLRSTSSLALDRVPMGLDDRSVFADNHSSREDLFRRDEIMPIMRRTLALVLFSFALAASCLAMARKKEGAAMGYKSVQMAEGLEIARANPASVIVDVRREDEYAAGHIPGAVLLTMESISAESAAAVLPDKNQLVLLYCRSGRRSKIAAKSLVDLGYTNVIEFGGILDYTGELE